MNAKPSILATAALSIVWLSGCCETSRCQPAPVKTDMPALLSESTGCPPAPPPPERVFTQSSREVKGDLVYNLGQKVVSNSSSVRLMGGKAMPEAFRLPGGVKGLCVNPVPERYYETIGMTAPVSTAPVVVQPVPFAGAAADSGFEPAEVGTIDGDYCAPATPAVFSPTVCNPGDDCFTLTEEEVEAGPELYVPAGTVTEPALPAVGSGDKYMDAAPVQDVKAAPATDDKATATAMAAESEPAPGAFPAESSLSSRESMPPVPMVTEMEETVDAILSRDKTRASSSVPPVELPPALN